MLKRMSYYQNLISYVQTLNEVHDIAVQQNSDTPIRNALVAVRNCFPDAIKEELGRDPLLHNELARKLYLRAHRMTMAVVEKTDYSKAPLQNVVNDRMKICSILNDHAIKIADYSTVQLKYFDTMMGILRKSGNEELIARCHEIDKELEFIK